MQSLPRGRRQPRWGGVTSLAAQHAQETDIAGIPLVEEGNVSKQTHTSTIDDLTDIIQPWLFIDISVRYKIIPFDARD